MATLALAQEFLTDFGKLDTQIRNKVASLVSKFQTMTVEQLYSAHGLHLEGYSGQKDPRARTVRVDLNHRGILLDAGNNDLFILTAVLKHDDADKWMMNNEFKVNAATGALEIVNSAALAEFVANDEAQAAPATVSSKALLGHRSSKDLKQLGIEPTLIDTLLAVTDEEALLTIAALLPQTQGEALFALTGEDSVEAIYAEIAGTVDPTTIDTDDVAAALDTPAGRSQFAVITDDESLLDMLSRPFAQWRVFLHPSQRQLAYRDTYNGPVRVTGGPGTGKTVVAIHRAKALVDQGATGITPKILVTTFTRNLADSIADDLELLGGSDLSRHVDVLNVDRFAFAVVQEAEGAKPQFIKRDELAELAQSKAEDFVPDFNGEFLLHEWEQVVLAQGIEDRDSYLTANRAGRGKRLGRKERILVWRAVEELVSALAQRNEHTFLSLAHQAARYLAQRSVKPFQHVIVDESQDLHEAQWRLLRAAVPEQPNDMFIVGDQHQRIYDRRSSLSKVGIKITGRSKRLRINYRTTHEIMAWSLGILDGATVADDSESDDPLHFAGYHSFMRRTAPTIVEGATRADRRAALVSQVQQWIADGVHPSEIGVAARRVADVKGLYSALDSAGVPAEKLSGSKPRSNGVRVATMHRMKGLEFRCVAVDDVSAGVVPDESALTPVGVDPQRHEEDLRRERCVLYVACTRAREDLWVGWSGTPSPFLT